MPVGLLYRCKIESDAFISSERGLLCVFFLGLFFLGLVFIFHSLISVRVLCCIESGCLNGKHLSFPRDNEVKMIDRSFLFVVPIKSTNTELI